MSNEEFLAEQCKICGKDFKNIEDVFVDIDTDNYICKKCAKKYNIKIINCLEYSEDDM